jgi:hypothetical protein
MKRSVALISVGITAFSIVLLASVVYGLRAAASPRLDPLAAASGASAAQVSTEPEGAAVVRSSQISPQAAVTLASEFLNRTDPFSVQLADYNGVQAYMVTFSSGDLVYISLSGQVLGSVPAPVLMASSNPNPKEQETRGGGRDDHPGEDSVQAPEHEAEVGN